MSKIFQNAVILDFLGPFIFSNVTSTSPRVVSVRLNSACLNFLPHLPYNAKLRQVKISHFHCDLYWWLNFVNFTWPYLKSVTLTNVYAFHSFCVGMWRLNNPPGKWKCGKWVCGNSSLLRGKIFYYSDKQLYNTHIAV